MNVVEPTIEFCDYSGLRKIELIGKVCTKQEDSIKPDSAETFCRNRLIDGHTAIFEHEYVYFNVTSIPNRVVREFVKLSPYIRWSYLGNYIGFSYRVFLDIMSNSRKMKAIYNDIYHPSEVNDLFYNMMKILLLNLNMVLMQVFELLQMLKSLQMRRRFIMLLIKLQPIEVLRMKPFVIVR